MDDRTAVLFKQQGETQRIPIPDTEHQFGIPFESRGHYHMLVNPLARRRFRREWGHKKSPASSYDALPDIRFTEFASRAFTHSPLRLRSISSRSASRGGLPCSAPPRPARLSAFRFRGGRPVPPRRRWFSTPSATIFIDPTMSAISRPLASFNAHEPVAAEFSVAGEDKVA